MLLNTEAGFAKKSKTIWELAQALEGHVRDNDADKVVETLKEKGWNDAFQREFLLGGKRSTESLLRTALENDCGEACKEDF
jgi:hypothetical protein